MSTTNIAKPTSASHWYKVDDKSVESFHHVPYAGKRGKNGETRSTTLGDARKVNALPSVTNVIQTLHKPFLEAYKINQAILACTTLPPIKDESADAFAKRALEDSKEHAIAAARLGSRCHEVAAKVLVDPRCQVDVWDAALGMNYPPESMVWFKEDGDAVALPATVYDNHYGEILEGRNILETSIPLIRLIQNITPNDAATDSEFSEFHIANRAIGYAGCCDGMMFLDWKDNQWLQEKLTEAGYAHLMETYTAEPILVMADIKTRGAAAKKTPIYETDVLQLAAYLNAVKTTPNLGYDLDSHNTPVCNLMLNTHPKAGQDGVWKADLVIHKKDDVDAAWETFKHLHAVWCWMKKYDPASK
jgi:hypothetical protein